jgi:hypothetical protein
MWTEFGWKIEVLIFHFLIHPLFLILCTQVHESQMLNLGSESSPADNTKEQKKSGQDAAAEGNSTGGDAAEGKGVEVDPMAIDQVCLKHFIITILARV